METVISTAHADGPAPEQERFVRLKAGYQRAALIGQWAADRLGIVGDDARTYAQDVAALGVEKPFQADLIRKLQADFKVRGVKISYQRIADELQQQLDAVRNSAALASSYRIPASASASAP